MNRQTQSEIETEVGQIIELLPTEQQIIIAIRYGDGPASLRGAIADARRRLEVVRGRLQEK